jgi:DUF1126 PH-like domain
MLLGSSTMSAACRRRAGQSEQLGAGVAGRLRGAACGGWQPAGQVPRELAQGGPGCGRGHAASTFVYAHVHPLNCVCAYNISALVSGGQVLRFFCVWDDRVSLLGDRRPYRLHYFLEDDTVEVLEVQRACRQQLVPYHCMSVAWTCKTFSLFSCMTAADLLQVHEANSGRDAFPVFLRRGKLPKVSPCCLRTPLASALRSWYLSAPGASAHSRCMAPRMRRYRPSRKTLGAHRSATARRCTRRWA